MPLIHLAFGSHHRAGERDKQIGAFQEHILGPRNLRAFMCPEFLPVLNNPGAMWGDPDSATVLEDGGVTFTKWVPSPPVALVPVDVWMISFVNVPLSKLRSWSGSSHYGRLGIAFTDDFVRRARIRRVHYYQYPNLAADPAVIEYNKAVSRKDPNIQRVADEILGYRKPARLWPEINGLFAMLKVTGGPGGTSVEKLTYSRYEINYSFEVEREARKVMSENERDLPFAEADVLAVIVPDKEAAETIGAFLNGTWQQHPTVMVHPGEI